MADLVRPTANNRWYERAYLYVVFAALAVLPLVLLAAVFDASGRFAVVISGLLCLLAISFPLLLPGRKTTLYEPLILMIIAVLIGCTLRAVYIAYSDNARVSALMLGQSYIEIAERTPWLILGLFALATGYAATTARIPIERLRWLFDRQITAGPRFRLALLVSVIVSVLGIALFVNAYDVQLSLDSISSKRTTSIITDDGEEVFSSLGYLRFMRDAGSSALYYFITATLFNKKKLTLSNIALIITLFVIASAIPFLSSSRATIGQMIINSALLFFILGRLNNRWLFASIVVVVGMAFGMAQLRSIAQTDLGYRADDTFIDTIVGSGNFVDISRTSAIISRVPANTDHLHGLSYLALVTAPIPKAMWPEKPNPSMGPWVRSEVFGIWARNNGWPPNVIGEAYINFGYLGLLIMPLLIGSGIKLVYNSFAPLIRVNPVAALIYTSIFWPLGISFIQLNFAQGVSITLQPAISIILFILLATRRARK